MTTTSSKPANSPSVAVEILRLFPEERRQTSSLDNYLAAIRPSGTLGCSTPRETSKRRRSASKDNEPTTDSETKPQALRFPVCGEALSFASYGGLLFWF